MNATVEKKGKSTPEQLREIRDKVSTETQNMTFLELKNYIESQLQESLFPMSVWATNNKNPAGNKRFRASGGVASQQFGG